MTGAQQVRYCPRCATRTVFEPRGEDAALACQRCRYTAGDALSDTELLLMADHFKLPLPTEESRVLV